MAAMILNHSHFLMGMGVSKPWGKFCSRGLMFFMSKSSNLHLSVFLFLFCSLVSIMVYLVNLPKHKNEDCIANRFSTGEKKSSCIWKQMVD